MFYRAVDAKTIGVVFNTRCLAILGVPWDTVSFRVPNVRGTEPGVTWRWHNLATA